MVARRFIRAVQDELFDRQWSKTDLAEKTHIPIHRLRRVLKPETAVGTQWVDDAVLAVGRELGISADKCMKWAAEPDQSGIGPRLNVNAYFGLRGMRSEKAGLPPANTNAVLELTSLAERVKPGARSVIYICARHLPGELQSASLRLLDKKWSIRRIRPQDVGPGDPNELLAMIGYGGSSYEVWEYPMSGLAFILVPEIHGLAIWWEEDPKTIPLLHGSVRFSESEAIRRFTERVEAICDRTPPVVRAYSTGSDLPRDLIQVADFDDALFNAEENKSLVRLVKDGPGYSWVDETTFDERLEFFKAEIRPERSVEEDEAIDRIKEYHRKRWHSFIENPHQVERKQLYLATALEAWASHGTPPLDDVWGGRTKNNFTKEQCLRILGGVRERVIERPDLYKLGIIEDRRKMPLARSGRPVLWEIVERADGRDPSLFIETYTKPGRQRIEVRFVVTQQSVIQLCKDEFDRAFPEDDLDHGRKRSITIVDHLLELVNRRRN